jgi:hypothetical protein
MAPGLTEETPLPINGVKGHNVENGKHSMTEEVQGGPALSKKGKYNAIPGPLGLASASLEGKVALVTGAGELDFPSTQISGSFFHPMFHWTRSLPPLCPAIGSAHGSRPL